MGSAVLSVGLVRLGDKTKKSHALIATLGFFAFALLLLVLFGDLRVLVVTHFLIGAYFLSWSLTGAIVGSQAPESARAFSVAIPLVIGVTGAISAPYLGGVLYEPSPFHLWICVIVALIGFALAKLD